jgi:hypothetical protein
VLKIRITSDIRILVSVKHKVVKLRPRRSIVSGVVSILRCPRAAADSRGT